MSSTGQEYARVPVKPRTHEELRAAKRGGESFDDVVRRLLANNGASDRRQTPGE